MSTKAVMRNHSNIPSYNDTPSSAQLHLDGADTPHNGDLQEAAAS